MGGAGGLGGGSLFGIVSAMITPAILILATGSLVASTLTRLARVVDRARTLIERVEVERARGDEAAARRTLVQLAGYKRRSMLVDRALRFFYWAIGLFIASSLAIAIDKALRDAIAWAVVALVILGAMALLLGAASLILETGLAAGVLRSEIEEIEAGGAPPG
jgi:hypothetical protein